VSFRSKLQIPFEEKKRALYPEGKGKNEMIIVKYNCHNVSPM